MHKPAAHTRKTLNCVFHRLQLTHSHPCPAFGAVPGPGDTTATPLLLSLSWTMRGQGRTLQGVCHTHHSL